jgi:hypothetical protein
MLCRSALEAVVAADVELMELRAEERELLDKLENPEQQDADVRRKNNRIHLTCLRLTYLFDRFATELVVIVRQSGRS